MKIKTLITVVSTISLISLCGCAKIENVNVDKDKVPVNYEASYKITTDKFVYNNNYTVKFEGDELVISSKVDEYWDNNQEGDNYLEGRQIMTTLSKLNGTDNFGVPNLVEEEFYITADKSYYTKFTFEHDHEINAGLLKIKKYSANSESGFSEENHTLQLDKQYFDKDSLPFIIAGFTEKEGAINVSSGNRSSLQAVKFEHMENESVKTKAGTFDCSVIRLRPNTDFSVNSARIYVDSKTGIPVKIVHDSSVMELTSIK